MTAGRPVPPGVTVLEVTGPTAWSRWAQRQFAPLEVMADLTIGGRRMRLAPPGSASWQRTGQGWRRASAPMVVGLMRTPAQPAARLLLMIRGRPDGVIADLAVSAPRPVAEVLAWLGWPARKPLGLWPVTIRDRLAARSNDYWVLDLAAAAVGLGDLLGATATLDIATCGVSVVVPARDVHGTLSETVAAVCVAAQRLPAGTPWECLVADDASSPPLGLPNGVPPQVRLVRSDRQVFCGGARNLGLAQARYPLVVFCDADTQLAPNYLVGHATRHLLAPNLVTVSLREGLPPQATTPDRPPDGGRDTRVEATYQPGRLGLVPVVAPVTIQPLSQTRQFRDFGHARLLGPVDLPFMVKGNNLAVSARLARIGFPPDFVGYGPEDGLFAAKAIAQGAFVLPVLSTGVFHRDHPPRSGSYAARDAELAPNLIRQDHHLNTPADTPWILGPPSAGVTA